MNLFSIDVSQIYSIRKYAEIFWSLKIINCKKVNLEKKFFINGSLTLIRLTRLQNESNIGKLENKKEN